MNEVKLKGTCLIEANFVYNGASYLELCLVYIFFIPQPNRWILNGSMGRNAQNWKIKESYPSS
jgi:hypothetical protein